MGVEIEELEAKANNGGEWICVIKKTSVLKNHRAKKYANCHTGMLLQQDILF
jgi:hypothetical protein